MNKLERVSTILDDYAFYHDNKHFKTELLHLIIKHDFERLLDGACYRKQINKITSAEIYMRTDKLKIYVRDIIIQHDIIDNFTQDVKERLSNEC